MGNQNAGFGISNFGTSKIPFRYHIDNIKLDCIIH